MPKKLGEKRIDHELTKIIRNYKNLTKIFSSQKLTREQYLFILDNLKCYAHVAYPHTDLTTAIVSNEFFDEEAYQKLVAFVFYIHSNKSDKYYYAYFSKKKGLRYSHNLFESTCRLFLYGEWQKKYISDNQLSTLLPHFWIPSHVGLDDGSLREYLIKISKIHYTPRRQNIISDTLIMIDKINNQTKNQLSLLLLSKQKSLRTLALIKLGEKAS